MKYTIEKDYYSDFNTISINKLKERSFFVAYPDKKSLENVSILDKRYKSNRVISLNGTWDFKFYNKRDDIPDTFDTDTIEFDKIDVPSCIEYRGFKDPVYLNIRYEFKFNPPVIPDREPVTDYFSVMDGNIKAKENEYNHHYIYRRFFELNDLNKRYIITFLGVASSFDLFVNGKFVGYSECSHNMSEFDITDYVNNGNNELVVLVHRWCNGTYLECQDMFRNTGIFRDVLLRIDDKIDIYDLDFETIKKQNNRYDLILKIHATGNLNVNVEINGEGLKSSNKVLLKEGLNEINYQDLNVLEWNSETPNTYTLIVEGENLYIEQKIGFKTVEIKGDLFLINGKKVKLRGVNHHDTNPLNGYTMSSLDILKDIENAINYNVNTIRTSHYAPDPLLMDLSIEKGIYIVSEVDIETHGAFAQTKNLNSSAISNDIKWVNHYLDRMKYHYNRDKIYKTSIIMWSLGNESGCGINHDKMSEYLKTVTSIPVHYEGASKNKRRAYDVASTMYPTVDSIIKVGEKKHKYKVFNEKPYFMCEFAHAMGVGPGNIDEYMDAIYKYDNLIGGCIWEMNDHSVLKNGEYLYGGDNGEWIHDSNFCVDGLFYPNRTPSNGAFIMKHAYRPIIVKEYSENVFEITNVCNFINANNFRLEFHTSDNKNKSLILDIAPHEKKLIKIDCDLDKDISLLIIDTYLIESNRLVDRSEIVLKYQIKEEFEYQNLPKEFKIIGKKPVIEFNNSKLEVADVDPILFRCETDNDKVNFIFRIMPPWYYDKTKVISAFKAENIAEIKTLIKTKCGTFINIDEYYGTNKGILVISKLIPIFTFKKYIPRFGKAYKLDSSFKDVEYFGRDKESYLDMFSHAIIKNNITTVDKMVEDNIKPQESGNRTDTIIAKVRDKNTEFIFKAVDEPYNLGIKPYSDNELLKMKHRSDEINTGTYVTLSKFQMGIGTGSCGPSTLNKYKFKSYKEYSFRYLISYRRLR